MTQTEETTSAQSLEIPADIGRNDACPCGSGKKYKKCHMRIQKALSETEKNTREIHQLITAETEPYSAYKVLADIHANNLLSLFFDAAHELGPWRAKHANLERFLLEASEGKLTLPAHADFEFMRMRIDEPDVHLLLAQGADDPRHDRVTYQILTLRRNEQDAARNARTVEHTGWRLWDVTQREIAKSTLADGDADLSLSHFDIAWHPRGLRDAPTHVRPTEEEAAAAPEASAEEE